MVFFGRKSDLEKFSRFVEVQMALDILRAHLLGSLRSHQPFDGAPAVVGLHLWLGDADLAAVHFQDGNRLFAVDVGVPIVGKGDVELDLHPGRKLLERGHDEFFLCGSLVLGGVGGKDQEGEEESENSGFHGMTVGGWSVSVECGRMLYLKLTELLRAQLGAGDRVVVGATPTRVLPVGCAC